MIILRAIARGVIWGLVADLVLLALVLGGDSFTLSPAQRASSEHTFDLVGWHLANSMSKWTHSAFRAIPGRGLSDANRLALVDEYFQLGDIENELKDLMDVAASRDDFTGSDISRIRSSLERARRLRHSIRNDVEEALESEISSVVRVEGMGLAGELVFPPVDVRLMETPKALITSRRDRIERREAVLLDPRISVAEREEIEARLLESDNLSGLVVDIGGVATYPASVYNGADLRGTLFIMAHEWLHHYLFPRPLGRNMFDSPDMLVLNETVSDLAGRELGDMAYERIVSRMGVTVPAALGATAGTLDADPAPDKRFDFRREMQKTRRAVDALLSRDEVDMAESYMETRRRLFVENGHPIRKLNQAYFAFHGSYAESPASVSPIGGQARRLRELSPDLGAFMSLVSGVSSYAEFLEVLREAEAAGQSD